MSYSLAKALVPRALSYSFTPESDYQALLKLARWALRFSPLVSIDEQLQQAKQQGRLRQASARANGICIDLTGTEKLHGSEATLTARIHSSLTKAGLEALIATAPTIAAAWGLAHYESAPLFLFPYGKQKDRRQTLEKITANLPVEALSLSETASTRLHELGIENLALLRALPQKKLAKRLGTKNMLRIQHFHGEAAEPFFPVRNDLPDTVSRHFDISLFRKEAVQEACLRLIQKLLTQLRSRGLQTSSLQIDLHGSDLRERPFFIQKEFLLSGSMRSNNKLMAIIRPAIEKLQFPGGISDIEVRSTIVDKSRAEQISTNDDADAATSTEELTEFMNNIALRLGNEAIKGVGLHQSYLPEEASRTEELPQNFARNIRPQTALPTIPLDCPSTIFEQPKPILTIALLPDHPPSRLTLNNNNYTVLHGTGPERVSPEWWKQHSEFTEREYFKVQLENGQWLWIFRLRDTQLWFLHGVWS